MKPRQTPGTGLPTPRARRPGRRAFVAAGAGLALTGVIHVRPVQAAEPAWLPALQRVMDEFAAGAPWQRGRVELKIEALVENGNTVPVVLAVPEAAAPANTVRRLALFNERNPDSQVAVFHLGGISPRAEVATRMRLATSQRVVAAAQFTDGSCWYAVADVVVTLAACIEG